SFQSGIIEMVEELDIENGKLDEEALRESAERYQLVVRGSADGIWDWNISTKTAYYSPRFIELLGYSEDEFPKTESFYFDFLLHPEDIKKTKEAVLAHIEERIAYDVEYRLRTKSGEYRWFRSRGQAMWNSAGRPTRMAGSITDIHDRKIMETALREREA